MRKWRKALEQALESVKEERTLTPPPPTRQAAQPAPVLETLVEPVPAPETRVKSAAHAQARETFVEPAAPLPSKAAVQEQPAIAPPLSAPATRRKAPALVIAAAALLVLAGGGFLIFKPFSPSEPAPTQIAAVSAPATETLAIAAATIVPSETATLEPAPTPTPTISATETPALTATEPPPAVLVTGGADQLAFLLESNIWTANVDGSAAQQLTRMGR